MSKIVGQLPARSRTLLMQQELKQLNDKTSCKLQKQ